MKQIHSDVQPACKLIDRRPGAIVFPYSVNKKNTRNGQLTTAEACAKNLKEQSKRRSR